MTTLAIIGGSGLYDFNRLTNVQHHRVETPYGAPSDDIVEGELNGVRLLFLARHGRGHRLLPSEVNFRANIFALKKLGAEKVVSVSAAGSMREEIEPGHLVVVDQFIDRTKGRPSTFFGSGIVGHVMFADPVCPSLAEQLFAAASGLGIQVHRGGTMMVMEGPAFSTRAESKLHREMGVDLIGMTAMPEAKLAREAELCYATLALSTDYDCWHESEDDVTVEAIIAVITQNVNNAQAVIQQLTEDLPQERGCGCATALDTAIITDREVIPPRIRDELKPIFGRVL